MNLYGIFGENDLVNFNPIIMEIVLIITITAIILFVTEFFSADVTAFLVMISLLVTNVLTPEEALSGFSHPATITIFALLVLSLGLESTGMINVIGNLVEKLTGRSEKRIMFFTIVVVGLLSAFMNNTAIVAIFLPIITRLAKYAEVNVSRFLMPLSFGAMIGGTITIIGTSTNIIVAASYQKHTQQAFDLFEFSYLGIGLFIAFLLFMLLIGKYLLIDRKEEDKSLTEKYDVQKYITEVSIKDTSPFIGKQLKDIALIKRYKVDLIALIRENGEKWLPNQIEVIKKGDSLLIRANIKELLAIEGHYGLKIKKDATLDDEELTSEHAVLFEAVIAQSSSLIGRKVKAVNFRQMFRAVPLAIRRSGVTLNKKVSEVKIQFGDVLLIEGRRRNLSSFSQNKDFIVLEKIKKPNLRKRKMGLSLLVVIAVIVSGALNIVPILTAALIGCAILFVTNCMSIKYVYRKMEWRVFFLLAGILPLGIAVQKVGLDKQLVEYLLLVGQDASPTLIISLLFLVTTILTSVMSNNATAVLLSPVAIQLAEQLALEPKAFLATVMFAASTSFATPIGYQTNTLIYGIGQYKFTDFLKVGGLLTLLVWLLATVLIPLLYL